VSLLTKVVFEGDRAAALARLPAKAGVGQILGPEGRNLLIGRPANLKRWAATHLGLGKPVAKGKRPPTDLSPIATAVAFAEATSPFHQRLLFERLMDRHVPRAKRRDLKPAAFLHLDPAERFPRLSVRGALEDRTHAFGPFRDRRAAERARVVLHKLWPLRPCDYVFDPDPQLPLGLGCLYAQVRSCAAPCLSRVSELDYRGLALTVEAILAGSQPRPDELGGVLPAFVAGAGARGLVVASNRDDVELYPVVGGAVCEEGSARLARAAPVPAGEDLEVALGRLRFEGTSPSPDDLPWLLQWILGPRRGGAYLVLGDSEGASALAARVREVLT
jgi:hypothetical protein